MKLWMIAKIDWSKPVRWLLMLGLLVQFVPAGDQAGLAQAQTNLYLPFMVNGYKDGIGSIAGTVSNSQNEPLVNATVCYQGQCVTTDSSGQYMINGLRSGLTDLQANADGYKSVIRRVIVAAEETIPVDFKLSVGQGTDLWINTISGRVISNVSKAALRGAEVCYDLVCTTSGQDGSYTLLGVPSGSLPVSAGLKTYETKIQVVEVPANGSAYMDFALRADLASRNLYMQVRLVWGAAKYWSPTGSATNPIVCSSGEQDCILNDLDLLMWVDDITDQNIFMEPFEQPGDCTIYPSACLEVDPDTKTANVSEGSGPEVISVVELKKDVMYYFAVWNVNELIKPYVPMMPATQARVEVSTISGQDYYFEVPQAGAGDLWYVFMMDQTGMITPTNCLAYLDPSSNPPLPTCGAPAVKHPQPRVPRY